MLVRALDPIHDWTFGKGKNDYLQFIKAIRQNLDTRLNEFLGDCFFNEGAGIDWFGFNGGKDEIGLNLAISSVILNTEGVTGIIQLSINLDVVRRLTVIYRVQTVYSVVSSTFTPNEFG